MATIPRSAFYLGIAKLSYGKMYRMNRAIQLICLNTGSESMSNYTDRHISGPDGYIKVMKKINGRSNGNFLTDIKMRL